MSKSIGSLFSMEATGTLGKSITFEKTGRVIAYRTRKVPQTEAQRITRGWVHGANRCNLRLRQGGRTNYDTVKAALGGRWSLDLMGVMIFDRDVIIPMAQSKPALEKIALKNLANEWGIYTQNPNGVQVLEPYMLLYGWSYALWVKGFTRDIMTAEELRTFVIS